LRADRRNTAEIPPHPRGLSLVEPRRLRRPWSTIEYRARRESGARSLDGKGPARRQMRASRHRASESDRRDTANSLDVRRDRVVAKAVASGLPRGQAEAIVGETRGFRAMEAFAATMSETRGWAKASPGHAGVALAISQSGSRSQTAMYGNRVRPLVCRIRSRRRTLEARRRQHRCFPAARQGPARPLPQILLGQVFAVRAGRSSRHRHQRTQMERVGRDGFSTQCPLHRGHAGKAWQEPSAATEGTQPRPSPQPRLPSPISLLTML